MGKPASRVGDAHACPQYDGDDPHIGGPVLEGCASVLIGNQPAARIGDPTACVGVGAIDPIATGEHSVLIGNQPAARQGDDTAHGGRLTEGCPNVFIGVADGCADGTCKNAPAVGSPVNPLLGAKILPPETDVALPSPLGWHWFRFYSSDVAHTGPFGQGWSQPSSLAVVLEADTLLLDTQGRRIRFNGRLAPGEARYSPSERLWLARGGHDEAPASHWAGLPDSAWRDPACHIATNGDGQFYVFRAPPGKNGDEAGDAGAHLPLAEQLGRTGCVARYEWQDARLAAVTDSAGRRYRFHYERLATPAAHDDGWRLTGLTLLDAHTQAAVRLVSYRYSAEGDLAEVLDRHGRWQRRFHWHEHLMIGHEAPGRRAVYYEYDRYAPGGRVLRQRQRNGLEYTFDYRDGHTLVRDSLGRTECYWFAGEAGLRRLVRHDRADASTELHRHDPHGRLLALYRSRVTLAHLPQAALLQPEAHAALFHVTRYQHDTQGRLTVVDTGGLVTRHTWHASGAPASHTDPNGAATRFEYDALGRLAAHSGPDRLRTGYDYEDAPGAPPALFPSALREPGGRVRRLLFDAYGQLTAHTDCSGRTTRHQYDAWGRLLATGDAAGGLTRYERDRLGRVAAVRDTAGRLTRYRYDEADRVIEIEDAAGRVHRQGYDEAGRLVSQTPEGGQPLGLQYDAADRLTAVLTPNGAAHRLEYDALDRLVRETTPDGRVLAYRYDALGQLVERHDMERVVRQRFDAAGRLTERHLPATAHSPGEVQRYVWQGTRLTQAHTAAHTLHYTHDPAGRIQSETVRFTDPAFGAPRTHLYRYGSVGHLEETTLPNGLSLGQLTYGSGHVHRLSLAGQVLADIEHDALYRPARLQYGGGLDETLAYGADGALHFRRLARAGGAPLAEARYRYDALGRLMERETLHGARRYHYDALDRLSGESGEHHARYRFDPAGNRLSAGAPLPVPAPGDWAQTVRARIDDPDFDLLGSGEPVRLGAPAVLAWPDNRLGELDGVRYRYDAWGNLIERIGPDGAQTVFAWDADHRLAALARYEAGRLVHHAAYTYDVAGRRRTRTLTLPAAGGFEIRQRVCFDWDGDLLTGERIHTLGEDGAWHAAERIFAYLPGSFTPLARVTCQPRSNGKAAVGRIEWFHTDPVGAPLALFDEQGRQTWSARFDAWGRRLDTPGRNPLYAFSGATDPDEQPIRLPGQYFDAESGLHYNRYRYYEPEAGRYVTQDPVGLRGGLNFYQYPLNPSTWHDPLGLEATCNKNDKNCIAETLKKSKFCEAMCYAASHEKNFESPQDFAKAVRNIDITKSHAGEHDFLPYDPTNTHHYDTGIGPTYDMQYVITGWALETQVVGSATVFYGGYSVLGRGLGNYLNGKGFNTNFFDQANGAGLMFGVFGARRFKSFTDFANNACGCEQ